MDKKLVGAFVITLTAIVFTVGLSRYDFSQLNQIFAPSPTPNPSPTPSPEPKQSPVATPTPEPTGEEPSNLRVNVEELSFLTDGGLRLLIVGNITNTGAHTVSNVRLHIQTWFSDGSEGMDIIETLNGEVVWTQPFRAVNIDSGETFRLTSRWFPRGLVVSVPTEFWLDPSGEEYPYKLISSYRITALGE